MIAIYWADADTQPDDGGYVWYRTTTEPTILQQALNDVKLAYPVSSIDYIFIATWDHVGYYAGHTDKVVMLTLRSYNCVGYFSYQYTYIII